MRRYLHNLLMHEIMSTENFITVTHQIFINQEIAFLENEKIDREVNILLVLEEGPHTPVQNITRSFVTKIFRASSFLLYLMYRI